MTRSLLSSSTIVFRDKIRVNERATNSHHEAADKCVYHLHPLQRAESSQRRGMTRAGNEG